MAAAHVLSAPLADMQTEALPVSKDEVSAKAILPNKYI
jgi:hypothetical protein